MSMVYKCMTRYLFCRKELPIFVGFLSAILIFLGYSQLNSTTVLGFLHQAYMILAI